MILVAVDMESFYNLFVNIPNWQAKEPIGGRINLDNVYTLRIVKEYKGEKGVFKVILIAGEGIKTFWKPFTMGLNYNESENELRELKKVNKFDVGIYYNKEQKEGEIIIPLKNKKDMAGIFMMEFKKISTKKALSLLRKFDWKTMKEKIIEDQNMIK